MIAEVLSIGDEIRTGAVADANASYISRRLEAHGIFVKRHSCIGDDMETIVNALREMGKRCDVAIVSGGLGPTKDDMTTEDSEKAANKPLQNVPMCPMKHTLMARWLLKQLRRLKNSQKMIKHSSWR